MPDFYGQPTGVLENSHVKVEYLLHAGPRIVRLFLGGNPKNLLGEFPDLAWDTPTGRYELMGGHRLWAAPEEQGISYLPDSEGLEVSEKETEVELKWAPPSGKGLGKTIRIELDPNRANVYVHHKITNHFDRRVKIAPWAITAFRLGGRAYISSAPRGDGLQPDRALVFWPYSRWDDSRLNFQPFGLQVSAQAQMPPLKIGTFSETGWCAYLNEGLLFVKNFLSPAGEYPDRGCNVEVYCSDQLIELETLFVLSELRTGESVSFVENWAVYSGDAIQSKLMEIFPGKNLTSLDLI